MTEEKETPVSQPCPGTGMSSSDDEEWKGQKGEMAYEEACQQKCFLNWFEHSPEEAEITDSNSNNSSPSSKLDSSSVYEEFCNSLGGEEVSAHLVQMTEEEGESDRSAT